MKTVPLADSSGNLPLRASKNPVLGVFRHHCGELASVHQPKGRRSKTRYLICDSCGTDQCGGADYQARIKAGTFTSIEDLQAAENAVHTVKTDAEIIEPTLTEKTTNIEPEAKPLHAAPHAAQTVQTVNQDADIAEPHLTHHEPDINPLQAIHNAVRTVNSVAEQGEPKPNTVPPNDVKPMRIGFAAIIGGLIGGLLAAVA